MMKVLLYAEGLRWIGHSGIARALQHQEIALNAAQVRYTKKLNDTFEVVHVNTYFLNSWWHIRQWKKRGIPIVFHAHSTEQDFRNSFRFSNLLAPLFRRWIIYRYNQGAVVITPTTYAKELLIAAGVRNKIHVISNGIDLDFFQKESEMRARFREKYEFGEDEKIVMSVGLYIERKGILDFVSLAERMPEYTFIWFGSLNLWEVPRKIKKAVQKKLPNLIFAGYVDPIDLRDAYAGADLFFFPTYEETEGIVLLEAMAMEQQVLIRDIPIYEVFENRKDLYKGSNNDEFEKLIHAILKNELPSLTDQGKQQAEAREIKKIGSQLKAVYQEVQKMGNPPTSPPLDKKPIK